MHDREVLAATIDDLLDALDLSADIGGDERDGVTACIRPNDVGAELQLRHGEEVVLRHLVAWYHPEDCHDLDPMSLKAILQGLDNSHLIDKYLSHTVLAHQPGHDEGKYRRDGEHNWIDQKVKHEAVEDTKLPRHAVAEESCGKRVRNVQGNGYE